MTRVQTKAEELFDLWEKYTPKQTEDPAATAQWFLDCINSFDFVFSEHKNMKDSIKYLSQRLQDKISEVSRLNNLYQKEKDRADVLENELIRKNEYIANYVIADTSLTQKKNFSLFDDH